MDDIDLIEMVNLPQADTGVQGIIYISSAQGQHGPRIKWFPRPPASRNDPCLSVSVGPDPDVRNLNLPPHIASQATNAVRNWVIANHAALRDFWDNGYAWTRQQVNTFIDGLTKI
jgi:hypothetical protein